MRISGSVAERHIKAKTNRRTEWIKAVHSFVVDFAMDSSQISVPILSVNVPLMWIDQWSCSRETYVCPMFLYASVVGSVRIFFQGTQMWCEPSLILDGSIILLVRPWHHHGLAAEGESTVCLNRPLIKT